MGARIALEIMDKNDGCGKMRKTTRHLTCATYTTHGKARCTSHYTSYDMLSEVIKLRLKRCIKKGAVERIEPNFVCHALIPREQHRMSLLQMSISAGVMILVVTVIRAITINRFPKKTFLALWGIVLARLLLPFSWLSRLSVYSLISHPMAEQIGGAPTVNGLPISSDTSIADTSFTGLSPWVWIWGIGAVLCILYFMVAYIRCRHEFKKSQPVENVFTAGWLSEYKCKRPITIRQTSGISAPLTYGIFRPVILMPAQTDWTDTKNPEQS